MWTLTQASRVLPAALFAAGLLISAPACSADIYASRRGPYVDIGRRAYDNGYRDGLEEGRDDARHHRPFSLDRHGEYRNADRGYRRGDGERNPYREGFRRGFEAGYRDAYSRYERDYRRDGDRHDRR